MDPLEHSQATVLMAGLRMQAEIESQSATSQAVPALPSSYHSTSTVNGSLSSPISGMVSSFLSPALSDLGTPVGEEGEEESTMKREGAILKKLLSTAGISADEDTTERDELMAMYGTDDLDHSFHWVVQGIIEEFLRGKKRVFQTWNGYLNLPRIVKDNAEKLLAIEGSTWTDDLDKKLKELVSEYQRKRHLLASPSHNAVSELKPLLTRFLSSLLKHPQETARTYCERMWQAVTKSDTPKLRIVIILVGSRGDVQPFIALGKRLQSDFGHRVRIATHETFRSFVTSHGLQFFSLPGDPKALIDIMVKHDLLSPGMAVEGFRTKRPWLKELFPACYRACITPLDGEDFYRADTIIANPPSFAGVHIAEKLGIPCHMAFTMPWTPTSSVQSPFITNSFYESGQAKYLTYRGVDLAIWAGIRDIVQSWRTKVLRIPRLKGGHRVLRDKNVPFLYCFSEYLIPRPEDWSPHCQVTGFWFLDNPDADFSPPPALERFLEDPPVFIGFGSIVVDDPKGLMKTVLEAVRLSGQRAIIQQGWAGIDSSEVPEGVMVIGAAPHDWLFSRCKAVVHHGGAGTTAAGIRAGKPTVVVPFFGDQFFWGQMISSAGAGPSPVPYAKLTAATLGEAIRTACSSGCLAQAAELGAKIRAEDGVGKAIDLFHSFLPLSRMSCQGPCDGEQCPSGQVAVVFNKTTERRMCRDCDKRLRERGASQSPPKTYKRYLFRYVDWDDQYFHLPEDTLVGEELQPNCPSPY